MTPEAIDWPAFPVVWTILFSRMLALPKARRMEMESTEMGMLAATVKPARSPTYTVTAPKSTPKIAPSSRARKVSSGRESSAGTKGLNAGLMGAAVAMGSRSPGVNAGLTVCMGV